MKRTFKIGNSKTGKKIHIIDITHGLCYCTKNNDIDYLANLMIDNEQHPQLINIKEIKREELEQLERTGKLCKTCYSWYLSRGGEFCKACQIPMMNIHDNVFDLWECHNCGYKIGKNQYE